MNAPVPPVTDGQADPLKQPSQFPGGYGPGFSSQSESTVDPPEIPQETLQSGEGTALADCLASSLHCPDSLLLAVIHKSS